MCVCVCVCVWASARRAVRTSANAEVCGWTCARVCVCVCVCARVCIYVCIYMDRPQQVVVRLSRTTTLREMCETLLEWSSRYSPSSGEESQSATTQCHVLSLSLHRHVRTYSHHHLQMYIDTCVVPFDPSPL
eukprot:GHVU01097620.1.p2 GENE.GHVU01097620.1~~GHVU01097620.1.p2  ORF type:complete len:132 (+),score=11.30 GHVU01097620.1:376-771(+)